MANLLPMEKAIDQLNYARDVYGTRLAKFVSEPPKRKREAWLKLQEAYGNLSAAHWELQQVFVAEGSK